MIELAPNHKVGLPIDVPIMVGGGVVGAGEYIPTTIRQSGIGAFVVGPILRSSRRGSDPPRVAETGSGVIVNSGFQNRGVRKAVKQFSRTWRRLRIPIIAQVADTDEEALLSVTRQLEGSGSVNGFEVLAHPDAEPAELHNLVSAMVNDCELPIMVKLPYDRCVQLADTAVKAGADALVVCQPPMGTAATGIAVSSDSVQPVSVIERTSSSMITGSIVGPALLPLMLQKLVKIVDLQLGVPLIACGGIHKSQDVADALMLGATAVQLDGALWVEPGLAGELVQHWRDDRI